MQMYDIVLICMAFVCVCSVIACVCMYKRLRKLKNSDNIEDRIENSHNIESHDKKMLKSVFEFGDTITREVMVPRIDMITLDMSSDYAASIEIFCRSGFSRIPVLGEDADSIEGIAYFKDLVDELCINNADSTTPISKILRPATFVPESKPVDDLFRMMQETRQHMCLVIDEYAGIAGLVTLEDTIEEIVGELYDEHDGDEDEQQLEYDDNGTLISGNFSARFAISDINELFNVDIKHDDVDTILGLLNQRLGRVAVRGANANIDGLEFEAISVGGRRKRISRIKVSRTQNSEDA